VSTTSTTITLEKLRLLAEAGAVQQAELVGTAGGWRVSVQVGMSRRTLKAARGLTVRTFRTTDAALNVLREVGVRHATVDQAGYSEAVMA